MVIAMLRGLSAAEVPAVDLYVISPLLVVAQYLRERIIAAGVLSRWTTDSYCWTREQVGTVHTVKGREADSVVLVLGAPKPTQRDARMGERTAVHPQRRGALRPGKPKRRRLPFGLGRCRHVQPLRPKLAGRLGGPCARQVIPIQRCVRPRSTGGQGGHPGASALQRHG